MNYFKLSVLVAVVASSCSSVDDDTTRTFDGGGMDGVAGTGGRAPDAGGSGAPDGSLDGVAADGGADGDQPSPTSAEVVPTQIPALLAYLQAGAYTSLPAEAGAHPSAGPHFGRVRTFFNQALADSVAQGNLQHPVGAAAIKELFRQGNSVRGWSVMVKVAPGEGGSTWFWYEGIDGTEYAAGIGEGLCTGCHSAGPDFVRTPAF